jgi:hypothetical protein
MSQSIENIRYGHTIGLSNFGIEDYEGLLILCGLLVSGNLFAETGYDSLDYQALDAGIIRQYRETLPAEMLLNLIIPGIQPVYVIFLVLQDGFKEFATPIPSRRRLYQSRETLV